MAADRSSPTNRFRGSRPPAANKIPEVTTATADPPPKPIGNRAAVVSRTMLFSILGCSIVSFACLVCVLIWWGLRRGEEKPKAPAAATQTEELDQGSDGTQHAQAPSTKTKPQTKDSPAKQLATPFPAPATHSSPTVPTAEQTSPPSDTPDVTNWQATERVAASTAPILWLDAANPSSLNVDGTGALTAWRDSSPFKNHAAHEKQWGQAPTISATQPPFIEFRGEQSLRIAHDREFFLAENYTLVFVARGDDGVFMDKGDGYKQGAFTFWNHVENFRTHNRYLYAHKTNKACQPSEFAVRSVTVEPGRIVWRVYGRITQQYEQAGGIVNSEAIFLGRRGKSSDPRFFSGDLSELLIFNRTLIDEEHSELVARLVEKWQLTPPTELASAEPSNSSNSSDTDNSDTPAESDEPQASPDVPDNAPNDIAPGAGDNNHDQGAAAKQEQDSLLVDGLYQLHVNLGGEAYTDPQGVVWRKSQDFDDDSWGHERGRAVKFTDDPNPLSSTAQRGLLAFRASVPNGRYEVHLHFCEHWTSTAESRQFYLAVEGRSGPVDLLRQTGGKGRALSVPIKGVEVKDGRLDIDFKPAQAKALAILNAVSIRQVR